MCNTKPLKIKNIEDLNTLRSQINKKTISIIDAYTILYNSKKKLYTTKFWKDQRKNLIKLSCENCGSSEKMTLQHTKQPKRKDWTDMYEGGTYWTPAYRIILIMEYIDSFEEYMQCTYTKSLCNKCAWAEDGRGTTRCICNACKKNWVNNARYPICDDCRNSETITICWHCEEQIVEDGNKYNGCVDCRKELILCTICKKNYHTEMYNACYICNKGLILCDVCGKNYHTTKNGACDDCIQLERELYAKKAMNKRT